MSDAARKLDGPDLVEVPAPPVRDLLDNAAVAGFVKSRWYPGVFQWPTLIIFALILWTLLFGPAEPAKNWGTAMTWVLWWPLIPLIFLFLGRFWCAICPFAKISDLMQKVVGNKRPVPRFLKKYGVWVITSLFILITWADHVWGIVESPWGSGIMMLSITTGAIASGAFFQRRTWCRYVCPLGGMAGNYSRASALELRGTPEKCATCNVNACYAGGEKAGGCPLFEFPKTMDSNANCNLCGDCVKNCPNDSPTMSFRPPNRELWFIRKPKMDEALLAVMITGMVFIQNVTMLKIWEPLMGRVAGLTGTESLYATFTIPFAATILVTVGLMIVAALFGRLANGDSVKQNFAKFGYALIPLVMAGHMGHNLFHLLAEGKNIGYTTMATLGAPMQGGSAALVGTSTLVAMQFVLILIGAAGSLYTVYRIAKNNYGAAGRTWLTFMPYAALLLVITGASLWMLKFPMAMRM